MCFRLVLQATVIDPADYAGLEAALVNNKVSSIYLSLLDLFLSCNKEINI